MFYVIVFAVLIVLAVVYTVTFLLFISDRKVLYRNMGPVLYIAICIVLPVMAITVAKFANICLQSI